MFPATTNKCKIKAVFGVKKGLLVSKGDFRIKKVVLGVKIVHFKSIPVISGQFLEIFVKPPCTEV